MNKAELVEALAQHYDGSKNEAARALNAVVQTITRSTAAGEKVAITGFGVFEKVERPARMVRNPRTGERKEAPATAVPRFRAGTELKAYVAGERELPDATAVTAVARPARTRARAAAAPVVEDAAPAPAEPVKAEVKRSGAAKKAGAEKTDAKKSGKAGSKKAEPKKSDAKKSDKKSDKKSKKK